MRNIAIIPARSGSKGLKDKNIKLLCGKPLLAYSIEAARETGMFSKIHVSTDSKEYLDISRAFGADTPFLRSVYTSSDTASSWDVVQEVIQKYSEQGQFFDSIMLLQPTSPLRTSEDICNAFNTMVERNAQAVVSVSEMEHSPLWCGTLPQNQCMDGFISSAVSVSRQKLEKYYRVNGAIYLVSSLYFSMNRCLNYNSSCFAYVMPSERSIDIDTEFDFELAEFLMKKKQL